MPELKKLDLGVIRLDGGTQSREKLDTAVVDEYAELILRKVDLGPIDVFFDGVAHWMGNGFHRYFGHQKAGKAKIECRIHTGTQRDAQLFAAAANPGHGLRRTNGDKRKSVSMLLDDPEWSKWSDRRIADHCCVSHPFVAEVRASMSGRLVTVTSPGGSDEGLESTSSATRTGRDGKERPATNPKRQADKPSPRVVADGDAGPADDVPEVDLEEPRAGAPAYVCDDCGVGISVHLVHCPGCAEHVNGAAARCSNCKHDIRGAQPARRVDVAPVKKAPAARDAVGQELPALVAAVFRILVPRIEAQVRLLHEAAREIEQMMEELRAAKLAGELPEGEVLFHLAHRDPKALRDMAAAIRLSAPHALCCYCRGADKACTGCKGGGWLSRSAYEAAPATLKAA